MATISRNAKSSAGGGSQWLDATLIEADEHNADHNTVYNAINGNLDNINIAAGAAIELSKLDGYSDSAGERRTETSPGVTGSESDASTMQGELERIRYKLHEIGLGTSTVRNTTVSGDDTYWIDTPQMGPNLIRNGNFAVKTTAAAAAPDGWSLVGTPGTCELTNAGVTEGHSTSKAIRIAAAGAGNEGISQTLVGLKRNTKYVVGCRAKVNAGGDIFALTTSGGTGAVFGNLNLTTSSTTYVTIAGVFVTEDDAAPADIVVSLLAVADGDSVDVTHCWVCECASDKLPTSDTAVAYNEITGNTASHYTTGGYVDSGLTASLVVPASGYIIHVETKLTFQRVAVDTALSISLRENGTEVDSFPGTVSGAAGLTRTAYNLSYINRSPVAGTTYTYTVFVNALTNDVSRNGTPQSTETPKSWVRCRAVLESGGH